MKNLFILSITVVFFLLTHVNSIVLSAEKYNLKRESSMSVKGTSTIHDWEINVTDFSSHIIVIFDKNKPESITWADFNCKVNDLKSNNKLMDSKTYKAFKEEVYPTISFQYKELKSFLIEGETFRGAVGGILSMAGVSRPVELYFEGKVENEINISGKVKFKMTDFKIEPPTAMMGALKTGDEIEINFNLIYEKSS